MTDQEIFDPAAIEARQKAAALHPPALNHWSGAEEASMRATLSANGMSDRFDGTYPHTGEEKRAGFKNPPTPGSMAG